MCSRVRASTMSRSFTRDRKRRRSELLTTGDLKSCVVHRWQWVAAARTASHQLMATSSGRVASESVRLIRWCGIHSSTWSAFATVSSVCVTSWHTHSKSRGHNFYMDVQLFQPQSLWSQLVSCIQDVRSVWTAKLVCNKAVCTNRVRS